MKRITFCSFFSSLPSPPSFPSFLFYALPFLQCAMLPFTVWSWNSSSPPFHLFPLFTALYCPRRSFSTPDFRRLPCIIALSSLRRPDRRHPSGKGAGRQRREADGMMEERSGEKRGGLVMDGNTRRHWNDAALFPNWHHKHWLCTEAVKERSHWQIQFKENALLTNTAIRSNSCGNILSHWLHHSSSYCVLHFVLLPTSRHPIGEAGLIFRNKQNMEPTKCFPKVLVKDLLTSGPLRYCGPKVFFFLLKTAMQKWINR